MPQEWTMEVVYILQQIQNIPCVVEKKDWVNMHFSILWPSFDNIWDTVLKCAYFTYAMISRIQKCMWMNLPVWSNGLSVWQNVLAERLPTDLEVKLFSLKSSAYDQTTTIFQQVISRILKKKKRVWKRGARFMFCLQLFNSLGWKIWLNCAKAFTLHRKYKGYYQIAENSDILICAYIFTVPKRKQKVQIWKMVPQH